MIRIPSPENILESIARLETALANTSTGNWYRTHGVVVAMDGEAVALTDTETLTKFGVCSHPPNPLHENSNARLICDMHNSLPSLLAVIKLLMEVPEAREKLVEARTHYINALRGKTD